MSLEKKFKDVALAAAIEAMQQERGRCLWCIDEVVRETEVALGKAVLTSAAQEQVSKVKLQLAKAFAARLSIAIVSGVRPPGGAGGGTDAADVSQINTHCHICKRPLDDPRGCDKSIIHRSADHAE